MNLLLLGNPYNGMKIVYFNHNFSHDAKTIYL